MAATPNIADDESVTVVLEGIGKAAARYPGLIGRPITRPGEHEHPEYVVVFKLEAAMRNSCNAGERRVARPLHDARACAPW